MKNVKNFFLYTGLLVILVLSTTSISNGQAPGSNGQQQGCGNGFIDSGGNGSNNQIGDGRNGPSCGEPRAAPTATPEPLSMLLFGTGLVGVGAYARRRLRGEE